MKAEYQQQQCTAPCHPMPSSAWAQYELLKAEFTAKATTSEEYAAACQRAAKMAGV